MPASTTFWPRRKLLLGGALAGASILLSACRKTPVPVGFLGGLTGPAADIGLAGRDGALLSVEHWNAAGGLAGRPVELVSFDDRQRPDELAALAEPIRQAGLIGMIGPMTSSVAAAWIPMANASSLATVSPTVMSADFSGQADMFFRVCSTTEVYARLAAQHHVRQRGWTTYAILRDDSNAAYTRSWSQHFTQQVRSLGAHVLHEEVYRLTDRGHSLIPVIERAIASKPQVLVVVTNAFDAARVAQWLRRTGHDTRMVTAEWAATNQLLELGGRAVEGVLVAQYFDRNSQAVAYQRFQSAFGERFRREPGFPEVAAYDAALVLLQAHQARASGESLDAAIHRIRRFEGLQQGIEFDDYGEASRELFITEVVNGRYTVVTG